jgi:hypothetical protein
MLAPMTVGAHCDEPVGVGQLRATEPNRIEVVNVKHPSRQAAALTASTGTGEHLVTEATPRPA